MCVHPCVCAMVYVHSYEGHRITLWSQFSPCISMDPGADFRLTVCIKISCPPELSCKSLKKNSNLASSYPTKLRQNFHLWPIAPRRTAYQAPPGATLTEY